MPTNFGRIQCQRICDCMRVHAFTNPRCQINGTAKSRTKEVRPMERAGHAPIAQTRVRQRLIHGGTCSIRRCATSVRRAHAMRRATNGRGCSACRVRRRPRLAYFGAGSRNVAHAIAEPAEHGSLITPFAAILQCDSLLSQVHGACQKAKCDGAQTCQRRLQRSGRIHLNGSAHEASASCG
jgi:hypothetical protein